MRITSTSILMRYRFRKRLLAEKFIVSFNYIRTIVLSQAYSVNQWNVGQTLLEATIALSALILILSATSVAIVTSINNSAFVKDQNLANKYSQEGMEFMRNMKNNNYIQLDKLSNYGSVDFQTKYCFTTTVDPAFSTEAVPVTTPINSNCPAISGSDNRFFRELLVRKDSENCSLGSGSDFTEVIVRTKWASGKCQPGEYCHKSELSSCFLRPR